MDSRTQESFDKILEVSENKNCFECGVPSNQWASVNNGIFLCLNCSGLHRGFGVHVSFVRSVTMDDWSDRQIEMMRRGGNKRLREFFDEYNIPKDAPIDFKYKTKAAVYYRETLKAEIEDREPGPRPSLEEGLEQIQTKNSSFNSTNMQNFGSTPIKSEKEDKVGAIFSSIGKFSKEALEATKNAAQKVGEKVNESSVKQGVVTFGANVFDKTKEIGNKAIDGTKSAIDNVKQQTQEKGGVVNYAKFVGESGINSAKKGFDSAWSFIKKKTGQQKEAEPQKQSSAEEEQKQ